MKIDFKNYSNLETGLIAAMAVTIFAYLIMFIVFLVSDGLSSGNLRLLLFILVISAIPAISIYFDNNNSDKKTTN